MYDDLEALNVDVVDVKLKNNFAIAFFDNFLVIDRSKCKTAAQERTVLAHEAGHYMSGAFYRAYSPFEVKEQAEHRAFAVCRRCAGLYTAVEPEKCKNAPGATNTESVQIDWLTQKEQSQPTL